MNIKHIILISCILIFLNNANVTAQILFEYYIDSLKGEIMKIETCCRFQEKHKSVKVISVYDHLNRQISERRRKNEKVIFYNENGDISCELDRNDNEIQRTTYLYKYDSFKKIVGKTVYFNDKLFYELDSILYNDDNLVAQYNVILPHKRYQVQLIYFEDKIKRSKQVKVIEIQNDNVINIIVVNLQLNSSGCILNKKTESIRYLNRNEIDNYPYKHTEEYEYVNYKYDKYGNWISRKVYLNWNEKGKDFI